MASLIHLRPSEILNRVHCKGFAFTEHQVEAVGSRRSRLLVLIDECEVKATERTHSFVFLTQRRLDRRPSESCNGDARQRFILSLSYGAVILMTCQRLRSHGPWLGKRSLIWRGQVWLLLKNPSYSCQAIGRDYGKKRHVGMKILYSPKERHESPCRMMV